MTKITLHIGHEQKDMNSLMMLIFRVVCGHRIIRKLLLLSTNIILDFTNI